MSKCRQKVVIHVDLVKNTSKTCVEVIEIEVKESQIARNEKVVAIVLVDT